MERVRQLAAFRDAYGHTRVPKRYPLNPALGNWVNKQRQQYRNYLSGMKPCSLNSDRIAILQALNFFDATTINAHHSMSQKHFPALDARLENATEIDRDWWNQFQELCKVVDNLEQEKNARPHTGILHKIPRLSPLGRWLQRQRDVYQQQLTFENYKHIGQEKSELNRSQLKALEALDVDWWMTQRQWQWECRFRELQQYAAEYGDCCVPISHPNRQLAHWVSNQRKQYNLRQQSKNSSHLTDDRLKRLNDLGFVWNRWEHEFEKKRIFWE